MRSSQLARWVLVLVGLTACALSHPNRTQPPSDVPAEASDITLDAGPCGAEGEACCAQTVDGGAVGSGCQADLVCDANRCARCPAGQSACDNQCIDTSASAEHCGACGQRCPAGTACARTDGGTPRCDLACMPGETVCGAACVATDTNVDHCGQCDLRCALRIPNAVTACHAGACQLAACVTGFDNCNMNVADGCEVNLRNDTRHCGACGNRCMLPHATAACAGGLCTIGMCEAGFADCNGDPADGCEVDLNTSVANCGRCGGACMEQTGRMAVCVMGRCGFAGPCPAPTADCDGNQSCETTLSTSTTSCGMCGRACSANNGAAVCTNGMCSTRCNPNFGDCDTNPANGCETSLSTSIAHCGACRRACTLARASTACVSGMCVIVSCMAGFADCDRNPANGCEVNTGDDPNNCNGCGARCPSAQMCRGGMCVCPTMGQTYCGGPMQCFDLNTNSTHCGRCGNACTGGQTCQMGTCRCPTGQTLCNGLCVNTQTNTGHCGTCGRACMVSNATPQCAAGVCGVMTCTAGFGNCDMNGSNGCEINTTSDANHCGRCGGRCPAGQFCSNSVCTVCGVADAPPCPTGGCGSLALCNGVCRNTQTDRNHCGACGRTCATGQACCGGMCRTTQNDIAHCGTCGNACPMRPSSTPVCVSGTCSFMCATGTDNCDMNATNGCETSLSTPLNCGACRRACNATNGTAACMNAQCAITCNMGFGDCDGNLMNGCETNTTTSRMHCGACMRPCMGAQMCVGGVCTMPDAGMPDTGTPDTGVMDTGTPDVPRDAPGVSVTDASRG